MVMIDSRITTKQVFYYYSRATFFNTPRMSLILKSWPPFHLKLSVPMSLEPIESQEFCEVESGDAANKDTNFLVLLIIETYFEFQRTQLQLVYDKIV